MNVCLSLAMTHNEQKKISLSINELNIVCCFQFHDYYDNDDDDEMMSRGPKPEMHINKEATVRSTYNKVRIVTDLSSLQHIA